MEASLSFEALGRKLRKARLDKKLKFPELSDKTKIQIEFLKKMEKGEFTFFPKTIIIGFIKSYVQALKGNVSEFLKQFEAGFSEPQKTQEVDEKKDQVKQQSTQESAEKKKVQIKESSESKTLIQKDSSEPTVKKSFEQEQKSIKIKNKKQETWFYEHRGELILGGMVLLILIGFIYVYIKYISTEVSSTAKPIEKISVFEARQQNLEKAETEKPKVEPEIEPTRLTGKVKLRIVAAESTWVHLVKDEFDTTEYIFSPGIDRSFEANEKIELRMGRADGLFLWVNSDSIGKLGTAAEIVSRLVLTREGIIESRVRKPQPRAQQN